MVCIMIIDQTAEQEPYSYIECCVLKEYYLDLSFTIVLASKQRNNTEENERGKSHGIKGKTLTFLGNIVFPASSLPVVCPPTQLNRTVQWPVGCLSTFMRGNRPFPNQLG